MNIISGKRRSLFIAFLLFFFCLIIISIFVSSISTKFFTRVYSSSSWNGNTTNAIRIAAVDPIARGYIPIRTVNIFLKENEKNKILLPIEHVSLGDEAASVTLKIPQNITYEKTYQVELVIDTDEGSEVVSFPMYITNASITNGANGGFIHEWNTEIEKRDEQQKDIIIPDDFGIYPKTGKIVSQVSSAVSVLIKDNNAFNNPILSIKPDDAAVLLKKIGKNYLIGEFNIFPRFINKEFPGNVYQFTLPDKRIFRFPFRLSKSQLMISDSPVFFPKNSFLTITIESLHRKTPLYIDIYHGEQWIYALSDTIDNFKKDINLPILHRNKNHIYSYLFSRQFHLSYDTSFQKNIVFLDEQSIHNMVEFIDSLEGEDFSKKAFFSSVTSTDTVNMQDAEKLFGLVLSRYELSKEFIAPLVFDSQKTKKEKTDSQKLFLKRQLRKVYLGIIIISFVAGAAFIIIYAFVTRKRLQDVSDEMKVSIQQVPIIYITLTFLGMILIMYLLYMMMENLTWNLW